MLDYFQEDLTRIARWEWPELYKLVGKMPRHDIET